MMLRVLATMWILLASYAICQRPTMLLRTRWLDRTRWKTRTSPGYSRSVSSSARMK